MTDQLNPTPPVTPPVDGGSVTEDWRKETFKARSERDNAEKQKLDLTTKLDEATKQLSSTQSAAIDLLRLRKSYTAGVPQHLLNLVTASDEAGIDTQIKTIMESLVTSTPVPNNQAPQNQPPPSTPPSTPPPPPPSQGISGGDYEKYSKATPEDRQKMVREWSENPKTWVLK